MDLYYNNPSSLFCIQCSQGGNRDAASQNTYHCAICSKDLPVSSLSATKPRIFQQVSVMAEMRRLFRPATTPPPNKIMVTTKIAAQEETSAIPMSRDRGSVSIPLETFSSSYVQDMEKGERVAKPERAFGFKATHNMQDIKDKRNIMDLMRRNKCLACFHLIRVASSSNTYNCKICSKTAPKSTLHNIRSEIIEPVNIMAELRVLFSGRKGSAKPPIAKELPAITEPMVNDIQDGIPLEVMAEKSVDGEMMEMSERVAKPERAWILKGSNGVVDGKEKRGMADLMRRNKVEYLQYIGDRAALI
ncbi:hypothetical protein HDU79_007019 [Rhizoclosmatium sp. JEL0117]|nr:hypothetical protein HDU79_007019 [Rhizoclosmatium sp. JEL0117]